MNVISPQLEAFGTTDGRKLLPSQSRNAAIDRVVIINDLSEARGGATAIALESLRLLKEQGIETAFISGDGGAGLVGKVSKLEALGSVHISETALSRSIMKGLYDRSVMTKVASWIATHDTANTVYHLHGWSKILSPSIFAALSPVARRVIIHAHDFFLVCPNGGYFDYQKKLPCDRTPLSLPCVATHCDRRSRAQKLWRSARQEIRRRLVSLEAQQIGAVVAVHEEMLPHLVRGGIDPRCLRVLRNPVAIWPNGRVEAERNRNFLYIGRLDPDKGPDLLAQASKVAGVPARFIGDGPLRGQISSIDPDAVLLGHLGREAIVQELTKARIIVMPSRTRETFGLAAFEAMSAGVPVVVPSFAMIAREVSEKRLGTLVNPYDIGELAAALSRLAGDDGLVGTIRSRVVFAFDPSQGKSRRVGDRASAHLRRSASCGQG